LNGGSNNTIYNNNFIGRTDELGKPTQSLVIAPNPNTFSQAMPVGGNYWSYFDTEKEGCSDSTNNGVCDQPFVLFGSSNADQLPWTAENGWLE